MQTALTPEAARDLGKTLRFIRHARNMTLHDVALGSGLSIGYIQNLEGGARTNASEETYLKLSKGYKVPESLMLDWILRARMHTALQRRGLSEEHRLFIWRGVESRLAEIGLPPTDLAKFVSELIGNGR